MARAGAGALAEEAAQKGMRTLAEHGQMLVQAGITSAAEIARVTAG
jgi:type II secretory ATPase GspE/PulE/Tfp pilus assembly ATPase PilB-like protein